MMAKILEHDEEARRAHLMAMPAYFVLVHDTQTGKYSGLVEGSFSIATSEDRVRLYWSSDNAYDNFGGGPHKIDGHADALKDRNSILKRFEPHMVVGVYDARSDPAELPVELDWEQWLLDNRPADTLSGVADKYGARNIRFTPKQVSEG